MMDERFVTFHFIEPIPPQERRLGWPKCGRCAAAFYLEGATGHPLLPQSSMQMSIAGAAFTGMDPSAPSPDSNPKSDLISQLEALGKMRATGVLDDAEFKAAKRKLLAM